jgi:hypothetical protein
VFHTAFDEATASYGNASTLVFNAGASWQEHQRQLAQEWLQNYQLAERSVIEIGCGEGAFLEPFVRAGCDCTGFEPGPDARLASERGIRVLRENFHATRMAELQPHAIICRHVLEHFSNPLDFLQDIALTAIELGIQPLVLAEVPCIEKTLEQNRISDFFYEHVSHFTEHSLRTLFELAGFEVLELSRRYANELLVLVARPRQQPLAAVFRVASRRFTSILQRQTANAQKVLAEWRAAGVQIALWGGAGKAAALINMLGLGKEQFPVVVDSDPRKVGAFVPGTGQEIRAPSHLKAHPVDGILICTNWRARDIEREIRTQHQLDVPLYVQLGEQIVELTDELAL